MFLLTREFLILSHLYREPWKKGGVTVVCNTEKKSYVECLLSGVFPYGSHICTYLHRSQGYGAGQYNVLLQTGLGLRSKGSIFLF